MERSSAAAAAAAAAPSVWETERLENVSIPETTQLPVGERKTDGGT